MSVPAGPAAVGTLDPLDMRALRAEAAAWDTAGELPEAVRALLAERGALGAVVPAEYGGLGLDVAAFGRLCESWGAVCTSVRSLLTVQNMVAETIRRWGDDAQRARWLPALARGEVIAGLAATEPGAGSELSGVTTAIETGPGGTRVSGEKKWITFGRAASVFLVLGVRDGLPTAVLVERDAPGVRVEPSPPLLGLRAAMVGDLYLDDARVGDDAILARPGFGLTAVVGSALDHGRFSVAWGCAGMVRACLEESAAHVTSHDNGVAGALAERQLVRRIVTDMAVEATSVRLLCEEAARRVEAGGPDTSTAIMSAKYAAGRAAARAASDAVQVQGARGCVGGSLPERFYRDAKIMQIIEGSDEVCQVTICDAVFRRHGGTG